MNNYSHDDYDSYNGGHQSTAAAGKYNMSNNPVYQIDCQIEEKGKIIASSKRRVCWKFGFSNQQALEEGLTGTDCRGEEHEVVMVWSLTSGKQMVMVDGTEVHYAATRFQDRLHCSWVMEGGHELTVDCFAVNSGYNQGTSAVAGSRQYDLQIDGMSFCDMPRMYQLGASAGQGTFRGSSYAPRTPSRAPHIQDSHDHGYGQDYGYSRGKDFASPAASYHRDSAPSRRQSLPLPRVAQSMPAPVVTIVPAVSTERSQSLPSDLLSAPVVDLLDSQDNWSPTAPAAYSSYSSPTGIMDEFTPVYQPPVAQAPKFQETANHILDYYKYEAPSTPSTVAESYMSTPASATTALVLRSTITPTMQPINLQDLTDELDAQGRDPRSESPMDKAVRSLVNFDNLVELRETPQQRRAREEKEAKNAKKGLPRPAMSHNLFKSAPLSQIQEQKSSQPAPAKPVMRTHAFDPRAAQAGMMVMYGQPQPHMQMQQPMQVQQPYYSSQPPVYAAY